jgi:tripartite-type tricarboxylate transporter receptor subunit TctC
MGKKEEKTMIRKIDGRITIRRHFMYGLITRIVAVLFTAMLVVTGLAAAQDKYPSRPVRIICPFPPGASTDIFARLGGNLLTKPLGQPFIVENVAGAGGTIGAAQVAHAKPDGYTLIAATTASVTLNPIVMKGLTYDAEKDFVPITIIAEGPTALVVGKNSPYKTLKELLAAAKAKPKMINFGTSGVGTTSHLNCEILMSITGAQFTHVPYKGTNPALMDVIAGRIDFLMETLPAVKKFIDSGDVRALGVGSLKRYPLCPEIPTMDEGGAPGFEWLGWISLMAPTGTPGDITTTLYRELAAGLKNPAIIKQINDMSFVPGGRSPADFAAFLASERGKIRNLVASGMNFIP